MPGPGRVAWCALFLSCRCSHGARDTLSVIQLQQQAVSATGRALDSALGDPVVIDYVPDVGNEGVRVTRESAAVENGSSLELSFSHFCTTADQFGASDCVLFWGMLTKALLKVHIDSGFQRSDVLGLSFAMNLKSHNESNPFAALLPEVIDLTGNCQLCEGSCTFSHSTAQSAFSMTVPTLADNMTLCKNSSFVTQEDFVLANSTLLLPTAPSTNLQLEANVTVSMFLMDASGAKRVAGSYAMKMNQLQEDATPSVMAAQVSGFKAQQGPKPLSLPESVGKVLQSALENWTHMIHSDKAAKAAGFVAWEHLAKKASPKVKHSLLLNLTVHGFEKGSGANVSIFGDHCTAIGSGGSVVCRLPLNQTLKFGVNLSLAAEIEKGATLTMRMKPQVGGMIGALIGSKLPVTTRNISLCGTELVSMQAFGGHNFTMRPPKCGFYALSLETAQTAETFWRDFGAVQLPQIPLLPFLPKDLDQLLPLKAEVDLDWKHADGSTIASVGLVLGVVKQ